ncbi:universal stress protein [Shewanella mesophila]|uniref:universal stress protein n=1 Tax=Shewanella mesophila TaxID=2864208 RepID=UPI001C656F6C|nr:universal stress protein [Shewanella mesophila]QYJ85717.1 universal stress protein [Shewanella mesophila]
MDKVFIISQKEQQQADAIATGVSLAKTLDKSAEVFAYSYESFSGKEHYNPRLAAVAKLQIMKQRSSEIEDELGALHADDVPVHTVWTKDLFEHACNHSVRHGFDLMVKAVHHADHYLPMDWHLIRHTKIPLMLLSDNPLNRSDCVLMAVDLGSDNMIKKQLNQCVIKQAKALAQATNSELHLAYIIRVPKILRDMDLVNTRTLIKDAYQRYQTQLAEIDLPQDHIHILAGEPDLCLYELSCRLKAGYVVLGARQRSGMLGYVIGNTVEAMLSRIRSNVLVIPADDQLLMPLA